MDRFEDSVGLFGTGIGTSTFADIRCDWCGRLYGGREDGDGEPNAEGEVNPLRIARFGELTIVECCFGKVEAAVLTTMPDIVLWYARLLKAQQLTLDEQWKSLESLQEVLAARH